MAWLATSAAPSPPSTRPRDRLTRLLLKPATKVKWWPRRDGHLSPKLTALNIALILLPTASGSSESDMIIGLDLGADDYLSKVPKSS
jgi:hypothetical protein